MTAAPRTVSLASALHLYSSTQTTGSSSAWVVSHRIRSSSARRAAPCGAVLRVPRHHREAPVEVHLNSGRMRCPTPLVNRSRISLTKSWSTIRSFDPPLRLGLCAWIAAMSSRPARTASVRPPCPSCCEYRSGNTLPADRAPPVRAVVSMYASVVSPAAKHIAQPGGRVVDEHDQRARRSTARTSRAANHQSAQVPKHSRRGRLCGHEPPGVFDLWPTGSSTGAASTDSRRLCTQQLLDEGRTKVRVTLTNQSHRLATHRCRIYDGCPETRPKDSAAGDGARPRAV